jgi:GDPmannose 4,6-dehydratase
MKKVALLTGITGQDGSYLAELLLEKGYEVHGIKRRSSSFNTGRIDHLYKDRHQHSSRLTLHFGDMTDSPSLMRIIQNVKPDEIYNLAAQSHVQVSFETPEYTANADAIGVLRLLEAIRLLRLEKSIRFYQASTSEMFGISNGSILNEESKFSPRSPYGVAKLYAHYICINYREAYDMFCANGILFNHESPRRGETFVTQKIVRAAVGIQKEKLQRLYLGNLNAVRDWGHAKDYVEGIWRILQYSKPEDWVLATGETLTVRDFASKVFDYLGMPIIFQNNGLEEVAINQKGDVVIEVDPVYFRPTEVPHLQGDYSKAKSLLNWSPTYSIDNLIEEMVNKELSR